MTRSLTSRVFSIDARRDVERADQERLDQERDDERRNQDEQDVAEKQHTPRRLRWSRRIRLLCARRPLMRLSCTSIVRHVKEPRSFDRLPGQVRLTAWAPDQL